MKNINELILYNNLLHDSVILNINDYFNNSNKDLSIITNIYSTVMKNVETSQISQDLGLLENYLLNLILNNENVFSLSAEKYGNKINGSLYNCALHDIEIIIDFYNTATSEIKKYLTINSLDFLVDYEYSVPFSSNFLYSENVRKLNSAFNEHNAKKSLAILINIYSKSGVGDFGRYFAFRYDNDKGLLPIINPDSITFDDLIGCEYQKNTLIQNTEGFIKGKKANNVLLFGDKGTGKSSSVKALINKFKDSGLRIIEITKEQIIYYSTILDRIRNRGEKFIIFIDDLSFEEFETEYKYMKAMIEGRIEAKPDNVLIYVTSNRRHLIRESFSDSKDFDNEIHSSDTVQEKTSLSDRFGITITFVSPNQEEFLKIVYTLSEKNNITMPRQQLKTEAIQWEMWHNGRSGRTAEQFMTHLINTQN